MALCNGLSGSEATEYSGIEGNHLPVLQEPFSLVSRMRAGNVPLLLCTAHCFNLALFSSWEGGCLPYFLLGGDSAEEGRRRFSGNVPTPKRFRQRDNRDIKKLPIGAK